MRRANHRLILDQQRRVHLHIAMFGGVQIEHELADGPFQTRQRAFGHHKTRTGHAGGGFEIHQAERFADFKMLLGLEIECARRAETVQQHVAMLVRTHGHFIERRVGNGLQSLFQLGNNGFFLDFGRGQNLFEGRHFGLQAFGAGLILGGHGLTDLFGQGVALFLRLLRAHDGGAAAVVDRQNMITQRRGVAVQQSLIKLGLVVADPANVIHVLGLVSITSRSD